MSLMDMAAVNLDENKPEITKDQLLCSGCWAVTEKKKAAHWVYLSFKFLESVNLCPTCVPQYAADLQLKQRMGL